jgi:general secretion pathway protein B
MSYILEALTKAERERKRGQIPVLDGLEPPTHPSAPRNPWLWVALFAVVFNAVLAGLLVYSSVGDNNARKEETTMAAQPVIEATAAPRAETPTAPPAPALAESAAPLPPAPVVPATEPVLHKAEPVPVQSALPLMTDAELQQQARDLAMEQKGEAAAIETPAAIEEETPAVTAPPPLEMIPLITEMPVDLQQALHALRVDVHVYADAPANRFVMINLRKYREGDRVNDDLYLERITREGMVLIWRGQRFRWLNKA